MTPQEASELAIEQLGPIEVPEGETTRGVDGTVIRIGGVATLRDASGTDQLAGACEGAQARFERANREGGVNGYTFEYVACEDDGQSAEANTNLTRELVEDDQVFALVPYSSGISNSGDYLNEQRVPYFGWGVSPGDYCGWSERQFSFSITQAIGCLNSIGDNAFISSVGIESYLEAAGRDAEGLRIAFVGSSDQPSTRSIAAFDQIAVDLGMQVVYSENPIPGAGAPPLSDYTPIAQAVIAATPDFVAIPGNPASTIGVMQALQAGGYTGDMMMFFFDPRMGVLAGALDGVYTMTPNFGYSGFGGEAYDQLADDLEAIGSDAPADGPGTLTSYGAADMFLQAFEQIDGPITTEALSSVINGGDFVYEPPGTVVCPSRWPSSRVVSSACAGVLQFDGAANAMTAVLEPGDHGQLYLFGL